jgi:Carboxypeptidase regulatory-like domain
MKSILFSVLTVILAASGCARDASPVAPDSTQPGLQKNIASATIRGQVYAELGWAEPAIAEALVEAKEDGGSEQKVFTDADGFYEISARPGTITITASKEGHQPKTQQFALSGDTVLNFGLDPM